MAATVTINDVLDGHVVLDIECLDRIYVNGYVPNLQVGGQVVSFLTAHLARLPEFVGIFRGRAERMRW
jgi:hypothetical protein